MNTRFRLGRARHLENGKRNDLLKADSWKTIKRPYGRPPPRKMDEKVRKR
jgi:hypothetical protein